MHKLSSRLFFKFIRAIELHELPSWSLFNGDWRNRSSCMRFKLRSRLLFSSWSFLVYKLPSRLLFNCYRRNRPRIMQFSLCCRYLFSGRSDVVHKLSCGILFEYRCLLELHKLPSRDLSCIGRVIIDLDKL